MNDVVVDAIVRRDGFELAVRLAAGRGETIGLVGDVGSGKSTVLALIAGALSAAEGRVGGPDGVVWDEPKAAGGAVFVPAEQRPVSWLRQRPSLIENVPAVDQVAAALGSRSDNGSAVAAGREAQSLLDELSVDRHVAQRDGWTLSGGETQRVALAIVFARRAPVVLLDDPYAALDARTGIVVRRWLADHLAQRAHTTVLACTDPRDTRLLADRVIQLR